MYNGSSWAPGTVSGGGSWTPTQLSSGFRIWDLDPGIYQMPASGTFYYYGSSGSASLSCTGGMLYIYSDNSIKCWYIITDYAGGASNGAEAIISGWSSSSGGSYGMHYLSSSNNGSKYFGVHDYSTSTLTTLNSSDRSYTDNGVFCSQINSSTTAKPTNLILSSATRMMMFVTRNYISGSYSGYNARQDLYVPSLHKHYYRYITFTTSSVTPITTTPNCDTSGWVEEISIPSYTSADAGKCLQVATGGESLQWATISGGVGGGYSMKYDEFTTFDTTNQGELKVTVSNTSSTEKLFTYIEVGSTYYQDIDQGNARVLVNITANGTASPGEHYLAISNQASYGQNTLPLTVTPEMILINNTYPVFHAVSNSSGAWDDIPYGVTRLYSYIILNHNGSLFSSPTVFITWCGDYHEI